MAKFTWNTGRFGYGKHFDDNRGGININVLRKRPSPSPDELLAEQYKKLIEVQNWDEAFVIICNAAECKIISVKRRDEIITHLFKQMEIN